MVVLISFLVVKFDRRWKGNRKENEKMYLMVPFNHFLGYGIRDIPYRSNRIAYDTKASYVFTSLGVRRRMWFWFWKYGKTTSEVIAKQERATRRKRKEKETRRKDLILNDGIRLIDCSFDRFYCMELLL